MKANVTHDQTVRTIQIQIEPGSVPDLDITRSYHRKPRLIRPALATLRVVDGQQAVIKVVGGLVLKSGAASADVTDNWEYRAASYHDRESIAKAPAWVRALWDEAPTGLTVWQYEAPQELS